MSTDRWDDLYDRLTSRKLILAVVSIVLAAWSYHAGTLTAEQFSQAVMVAVTAYTAAEGASDAISAWKTPSNYSPEFVDAVAEALLRKRAEQLAERFPDAPTVLDRNANVSVKL